MKHIQFLNAIIFSIFTFTLISCGGSSDGDDNKPGGGSVDQPTTATISTQGLTENSPYSITVNCKLTTGTAAPLANIGVLANEKPQPTINTSTFNGKPSRFDSQTTINATINNKKTTNIQQVFSVTFTGLRPNTTYYFRAYYNNGSTTIYGQDLAITTKSANITAIDLGLTSKTLWASCNIGAEKPQDIGSYFALSEVVPVGYYRSKMFDNTLLDVDDSKDPLGDLDETLKKMDPSYIYYGNNWRTPTLKQIEELQNECTWTWTDNYNGSKGYLVTSNTNGKQIFLPITGCYKNKTLSDTNIGFYNSRLITTTIPESRSVLRLTKESKLLFTLAQSIACATRPVMVPEQNNN